MKLRTFMQHTITRGLAAVMALIVLGGAVDWGHAGGDDPDCDGIAVVHTGSPGHVSAAPVSSHQPQEHCLLCHALRLLHAATAVRSGWACAATGSTAALLGSADIVRAADAVASTPRAPPSVLL